MPDVALSVTASPLTALLAGTPADPAAAGLGGQPSDPFAVLFAAATGTVAPTVPTSATAANLAVNPIAALLAGTAKLPAAPAPMPVAATVEALPATKGDGPVDADTDTSDAGKDPLADAIASGATAVLALAPTVVAPAPPPAAAADVAVNPIAPPPAGPAKLRLAPNHIVPTPVATAAVAASQVDRIVALPATQSEPDAADTDMTDQGKDPLAVAIAATAMLAPTQTSPVETPVKIDAPLAAVAPPKLGAGSSTVARLNARSQVPPQAEAAMGAAVRPDASSAQADQQAPPAAPSPTSSVSPVPPLSPEVAKAVVAALQQTADTDAAPADSSAPAPAAVAQAAAPTKDIPLPAAQPVAQQQSDQPVASRAPVRRRSDEVAAPRRTADTRRRVENNAADTIGLAQRVTETPREAGTIHEAANISAKGDTVVQQTLTIARDGAWLDRLARDIAGAGNGSDLHFKLDPQNLGALSVAISQSADGASIRLTADNDRTRNILLDAQPKLIAEARAQGLKVSDTHVDLNQNQNQSQNQPQQHNPNPDLSRWAQGNGGQNGAQSGQNRQSSPGHQPFVSNPERKAKGETESRGDSDALYA